jgi:hypothetical protein
MPTNRQVFYWVCCTGSSLSHPCFFWDIRVYAFPNGGGWYEFGFTFVWRSSMAEAAVGHNSRNFKLRHYRIVGENGLVKE